MNIRRTALGSISAVPSFSRARPLSSVLSEDLTFLKRIFTAKPSLFLAVDVRDSSVRGGAERSYEDNGVVAGRRGRPSVSRVHRRYPSLLQ